MSDIPFLSNINLNQNQNIKNVIENLASHPSNPAIGRIYYNTTDKEIYYYNGKWIPLSQSSTLSTQATKLTCTLPDDL